VPDELLGPSVAGVTATVIPAGAPEELSATSSVNPPPRVIVSPALADDPATAENDDGVAVTAIVGVAAGGVVGVSPPAHAVAIVSDSATRVPRKTENASWRMVKCTASVQD
jgi:hypothetical protein